MFSLDNGRPMIMAIYKFNPLRRRKAEHDPIAAFTMALWAKKLEIVVAAIGG